MAEADIIQIPTVHNLDSESETPEDGKVNGLTKQEWLNEVAHGLSK
jgi:hypothetical protein